MTQEKFIELLLTNGYEFNSNTQEYVHKTKRGLCTFSDTLVSLNDGQPIVAYRSGLDVEFDEYINLNYEDAAYTLNL